jgi:hypothetical protein
MDACRRLGVACALTVGMAFACDMGRAEDFSVANFDRIEMAKGLYEYNKDGVPILGLITTRMSNDRVKFTTCTSITMEVAFRQLKSSGAKCPGKNKDPGIWWTWASNTIMPLIKTGRGTMASMVKFNGKDIDLSGLSDDYKASLSDAKVGDWVGYAFKGDDGKKSLVLFAPTAQ